MRAKVKGLHSPDIADLDSYEPDDPSCEGALLQVLAGSPDTVGRESFDILVATPKWLETVYSDGRPFWGRHILIVDLFDWPTIELFIRDQFEAVEGESWLEIAEVLGRLGHWEFEDYNATGGG